MFKKLIFILLFISLPISVYADEFFPRGELNMNRYMDTIVFGISKIPQIGDCAGCIQFEASAVKGAYTDTILSSVSMEDITYPDTQYGLVRVAQRYDSVAVPPFSQINFVYFYSNETGAIVDISKLGIFLTTADRNGPYYLLDINAEYSGVLLKLSSIQDMRYGFLKMYEGLGIVNAGAKGSFVLDTVSVKSPLEFKNWEMELNGDVASLKITVENESEEYLNGIEYEHKEFYLKRNFSAYESYVYEYLLSNVDYESIGYPSIFNGNIKMSCSVRGQSVESGMVGNSAIMYGVRRDGNLTLNYVGSRTKPIIDSFCVTRLPYRMYAPKLFKEEKDVEQENEEVLGVKGSSEVVGLVRLPQTGKIGVYKFLPVFLVVIAILCYYHIRRLRK